MGRRGVGFTLQLVIVALILVATAATVIGLSGTNIGDFFSFTSDRRTSAILQDKCRRTAEKIQQNYCSKYVKTAEITYEEGDSGYIGLSQSEIPNADCMCDRAGVADDPGGRTCSASNAPCDGGIDETYSVSQLSQSDCSSTSATRSEASGLTDAALYQRYTSDQRAVYGQTASAAGCQWEGNAGGLAGSISAEVTVQGETYSCIEKGYIPETCPVQ